MLGNVDVDKLEQVKKQLAANTDQLSVDAFEVIKSLENTMVTMFQNHQSYCEQTATYIKELNDKILEDSWVRNPDRSGGQFSQDEIDRSRNGGW
jgi:division protein CdvB (Snf7/Vps24/ESCRT-III family)